MYIMHTLKPRGPTVSLYIYILYKYMYIIHTLKPSLCTIIWKKRAYLLYMLSSASGRGAAALRKCDSRI